MFKDTAYLSSLSLRVKRSRVGSARGTAKKLEVGFASSQPENSHHEKASLENLKNDEKKLQKVTFPMSYSWQNSFPNFKSYVHKA